MEQKNLNFFLVIAEREPEILFPDKFPALLCTDESFCSAWAYYGKSPISYTEIHQANDKAKELREKYEKEATNEEGIVDYNKIPMVGIIKMSFNQQRKANDAQLRYLRTGKALWNRKWQLYQASNEKALSLDECIVHV